jgi:transcriptional regulator with XRE-family HTH domain
MSSFGERLNYLRKEYNLKAEDLAEIIGVKRRIIFLYEKNEAKPSFEVLLALANHFDVSIDYLVCRTDKPEINK